MPNMPRKPKKQGWGNPDGSSGNVSSGKGRQNPKDLKYSKKNPIKPRDPNDTRAVLVFFHPDLGIGGAERLVVDAAVGLQERGHRVVIFTNHCDPTHCFDECRDGTLDVRVRASTFIPMSIFNRLTILCAILRHFHLLFVVAASGELAEINPTALIVDQLSAGLPILRYLCPSAPILFYCHFPDLLLARRTSTLKKLYRLPFDALEQWSMGFAQSICVNSQFTKGIVEQTWPRLKEQVKMSVVYPCVDTENIVDGEVNERYDAVMDDKKIILSINRFERKKDIGLAIKAFAAIPKAQRERACLVIAGLFPPPSPPFPLYHTSRASKLIHPGGYDERIEENVSYHKDLHDLAISLGLTTRWLGPTHPLGATQDVVFLANMTNLSKDTLLHFSRLLVYTPSAEHFGIVPIEGMRAKLPVLAATTGGPVETVVDGVTGWLRDTNDVQAWTDVMMQALDLSYKQKEDMGEAGAKRVKELFGRDMMAETLEGIVKDMLQTPPNGVDLVAMLVNVVVVAVAFVIGLLLTKLYYLAKRGAHF